MTEALWKLTAGEALAQLRAGAITPVDLAESCLARISRRESAVGAWQYVDADAVRQQAQALAARPGKLPLYGIPVGIKDIIDTRDMPTE
ncbi:MAG: amidase, partial [Gammaproteobacteria bacterium]|nr:amidase [Gammaproteobacteria bacterium]